MIINNDIALSNAIDIKTYVWLTKDIKNGTLLVSCRAFWKKYGEMMVTFFELDDDSDGIVVTNCSVDNDFLHERFDISSNIRYPVTEYNELRSLLDGLKRYGGSINSKQRT